MAALVQNQFMAIGCRPRFNSPVISDTINLLFEMTIDTTSSAPILTNPAQQI
jgi:hypothetical protein